MAVNKVIYGGNTLVDLTGDTVTAADLAEGVKATGADGKPIVGLLPKVTIDNQLSASSTNPVQNKVIKAELDKKMAKTDKIYEANLEWGGRNIADNYSPIDGAMVSSLGANRFAFGKAKGITVEYSEDAGATWVEYPLSDAEKEALFSLGNIHVFAGGSKSRPPSVNDMLRVTIDPDEFGTYTRLNKFIILVSTGGSKGCYCTIEASKEPSPTEFEVFADRVTVMGWSGYNTINTPTIETYSNQPTRQYGLIRFTFGCTTVDTQYRGLALIQIMGFGGTGWETPSFMAKHGHLYDYNVRQEATFPASVTAPTFIGALTGTATKAESVTLDVGTNNVDRPVIFQDSGNYAGKLLANRSQKFKYNPATDNLTVGKINGFTLETSVPANAKFTDTVYTHPATHPASMITGLSTVATSGSYNDLKDKPAIVKTVNNVAPDSDGNINITVSGGGGVSTDTANAWTAAQTFGDVVLGGVEKYTMGTPNIDGVYKPTMLFTLATTSSNVLTIDLSELLKQADSNQNAVHFKIATMCFGNSCALKIAGIEYLYANKATITKYMLLDGIVFKLYDTSYAHIYINALDLDLGDLS